MTKIKTCAICSVAYLKHLILDPLRQFIIIRIGNIYIHCLAVSIRYNRNVVRRFCPALDLKAVYTGFCKLINVLDKTHIFCVKYVCSAVIFKHRVKLVGSLFFHKMIPPAARLGTLSPVCISVHKILRKKTSAGKTNAHCTVHEAFNIKFIGRFSTYLSNFFKRKLSCQNNSFCTHIVKFVGGSIIYNAGLSGNMDLHIGGKSFYHSKDTNVIYYQRINTCIDRILNKAFKSGYLKVSRQCITGKI